MKYPQDLADSIANRCSMIGKAACLAFTYMWCVHLDPENGEAIKIVSDNMRRGNITDECKVLAEPFLESLTGNKYIVEKRKIKSLDELADIERCAVLFSLTSEESGHWVGVEYGKVKFNSKLHSNCLTNGHPVTARIIKLVKAA